MFRKAIFFLLLFASIFSFSQQVVTQIPLALKKDRNVFQIINPTTKQVSLFVSDKNMVNAIRLDEQIRVVDSLSAERPEKKYTDMIGYIGQNDNPVLFWSSQKHQEIFAQSYNFETRKVASYSYSIDLKNEKFLQQFSENDHFYIFTVLNETNTLKIYVFDRSGSMETKSIEMPGYMFFNAENKLTTFYGVLDENLMPFEPYYSLEKIAPENPVSLTQSAKKRKCYSKDGKVIMSFDVSTNFTQLITVDLKKFTTSEKIIYKPNVASKRLSQLNSNSFLIDGKLYQIKTSGDEMYVTLKTLGDSLVKEYKTNKDSPIDFKNSDIILENKIPENRWVYKKTSQFINKANNFNLGISCYNVDGKYLVTMGSVSENYAHQSAGAYVTAGILLGGLGTVLVMFGNSVDESFNAYSNRTVIYVNGIFDYSGNHIVGEIKPLAYDKMRLFCQKNTNDICSETLFKLNGNYYLGYYNVRDKNYIFSKYND
ncbi:MAG TPA: hypothetical protein VK476_02835 [Flavobacterium sp.]|nr:hypothetical protein [Flavobacterium sp.]